MMNAAVKVRTVIVYIFGAAVANFHNGKTRSIEAPTQMRISKSILKKLIKLLLKLNLLSLNLKIKKDRLKRRTCLCHRKIILLR